MPDPTPPERSVWASELLGAQVLSSEGGGGQVAQVTGLVMFPPKGVMALQVQPSAADEAPLRGQEALLLPFDAALGYAPGQVRVLSADDVVPAFKLPILLGQLTSFTLPNLGSAIRTVSGLQVGFLWDARVDSLTGELLQYRIGPSPQPTPGSRSLLTSARLCSCKSGEFTMQDEDAALVRDLLGQFLRPQPEPDLA